MKIIFIHGNGGCTADMNWYASADQRLRENGFNVIRETRHTAYFEFTDRGHFLQTDIDAFPERVTALLEKPV